MRTNEGNKMSFQIFIASVTCALLNFSLYKSHINQIFKNTEK